jgi:hypothetical protein
MDTGVFEPVTGYPAKALRQQRDPNPKRDFIARLGIPIVALIVLAILVFGCGHGSSTAVQICREELAVIHVAEQTTLEKQLRATHAVIERCRQKLGASSTPEQRQACTTDLGMSPAAAQAREAAIIEVGRAYDAIVAGLGAIERALPTLREAEANADRILEREGWP